jgi:hypothetical protein
MPRLGWKSIALVALAAVLPGCDKAPLTAVTGSTVFLQANPTFVIANGGVSIVTAVVTDPAGTLAADGTEVLFFTTLGRIDPVGKTVNGVANVNFVSDARSGPATITALSGPITATAVTISVGSTLPKTVLVAANPASIAPGRSSSLTATVFDENGNPVQNVPVSFSLSFGTGTLVSPVDVRLDSGGGLLYTNSNGQVFDTLRSSASIVPPASVTVTATTAHGETGSADVEFFGP